MGLGKADTDAMSLYEYEMRVWHWNEAEGDSEEPALPDRAATQRLIDKINSGA